MARTLGQAAALGYLLGCKTTTPPNQRRWSQDGLALTVSAHGAFEFVLEAAPDAAAALARFDLLPRSRVEVIVYEDRRSFARATHRRERWVRAWSSYDLVHVLAPKHWRDASALAARERLTHELAHVGAFHRLGDEKRATHIGVPFWFREGSASVVAQQGARRLPLDEVVRRVGDRDPLVEPPDQLSAYAAAHHAMAFVHGRGGDGVFAALLDSARQDGERDGLVRALALVVGVELQELWRLTTGA